MMILGFSLENCDLSGSLDLWFEHHGCHSVNLIVMVRTSMGEHVIPSSDIDVESLSRIESL